MRFFNHTHMLWPVLLLVAVACGPIARVKKAVRHSVVFRQDFTGFALYDPQKGRMLYEQNADHYFVPASNTKLFTYYTALKILGDSIPALKYAIRNDTLFFRGTGEPSLLHPDLHCTATFDFLRQRPEKLVYVSEKLPLAHFGPGWAWDDYNDYYSAEKSALPVYGNIVRFRLDRSGRLHVSPAYFRQRLTTDTVAVPPCADIKRDLEKNRFVYRYYPARKPFTQDVPFRYSPELAVQLLADTLQKPVSLLPFAPLPGSQVLYQASADSLYRWFMQESDNFIAEHLLLLCSAKLFDSLHTESAIAYAKAELLADLPDPPIWVDGSGLSRYNLFTPRTIIALLRKLHQTLPQERLFATMPIGGKAGTIKNWYKAETPFVFAKTGSMSNVHCLSGYVLTKTGRVLLFSFMHNNFTVPNSKLKKEMDKVLRILYEKY